MLFHQRLCGGKIIEGKGMDQLPVAGRDADAGWFSRPRPILKPVITAYQQLLAASDDASQSDGCRSDVRAILAKGYHFR